jgi:hypothetical protein
MTRLAGAWTSTASEQAKGELAMKALGYPTLKRGSDILTWKFPLDFEV